MEEPWVGMTGFQKKLQESKPIAAKSSGTSSSSIKKSVSANQLDSDDDEMPILNGLSSDDEEEEAQYNDSDSDSDSGQSSDCACPMVAKRTVRGVVDVAMEQNK